MTLMEQLQDALELIKRIQYALGTEETGENLVSVARHAHFEEQMSVEREAASYAEGFANGYAEGLEDGTS